MMMKEAEAPKTPPEQKNLAIVQFGVYVTLVEHPALGDGSKFFVVGRLERGAHDVPRA